MHGLLFYPAQANFDLCMGGGGGGANMYMEGDLAGKFNRNTGRQVEKMSSFRLYQARLFSPNIQPCEMYCICL
jgi:hypothetical protein